MKGLSPVTVFTPITVGKVEIKNRFVVAPMVTVFCDQDGMATERFIRYHEEKAKGGWGLITVEDYAVDPIGRVLDTRIVEGRNGSPLTRSWSAGFTPPGPRSLPRYTMPGDRLFQPS